MRRDEISNSIKNVLNSVKVSGIIALFEKIISRSHGVSRTERSRESVDYEKQAEIFTIYASFMAIYKTFSKNELYIMEKFQIIDLSNSVFWASLTGEELDTPMFFQINHKLSVFMKAAESFLPLLDRVSDLETANIEVISKGGGSKKIELEKMKIIIRENDIPELDIKHLSDILSSVQGIYDTIIALDKLKYTSIIIGSMDSGSDKSIDIIGVADAINKMSKFILECWDRIRFNKSQVADKSFKSVSEGVTVLNQIRDAVSKNSMSPEEGEKMKLTIIRSIDGLFENGVYITEMENSSIVKPSQLPIERRILLSYQDNTADDDINGLDDENADNEQKKPVKRVPRRRVPLKAVAKSRKKSST